MPRRVLLCDDEIHILRAAEFKLKRAGYEVEIAGDGQEGWEILETRPPDIVITDCQMPRCDGLGLVRRMRETPATRDIPVLMLTAKGFELSASELAEKYNVLGLIAKPFSPRELLQTVNSILGSPEGEAVAGGSCLLPIDGAMLPSGFVPEMSTEI
jgi:two-component system alkaline phosphatase synthesis response regulator PhoP